MQRLIIVSNRLPVTVERDEDGLRFSESVGGLATGLGSFYRSFESLWLGWADIPAEEASDEQREELEQRLMADFSCMPVFLSPSEVQLYYHGFSNKVVWPVFHQFQQYAEFDQGTWEAYERVNMAFRDAVLKVYKPGDIIWVHDYHLMLLPNLIREVVPDATIGFFLHIPFPSFETFRLLPWRRELLRGLLGADLLGFHTYDYVRYFLESVQRLEGHDNLFGRINLGDRVIKAEAFPMGIDYERFAGAPRTVEVRRRMARIADRPGLGRIVLSVDRMDYTKGIPQRLEAFDEFLERNPGYRRHVNLVLVAVPSREQVEHYQALKRRVDELVGMVNGKHGTMDWMPVWYLYRSLPFDELTALYALADVALVTPLRDGMNLIAKEFVASRPDETGVLVLSEMAGSAKELGEAIIINPHNGEEFVRALEEALEMPAEEQMERNRVMRRRLKRYDVRRWADDFLKDLDAVKGFQEDLGAHMLTWNVKRDLIEDFESRARRLLLFDYDGTLVGFSDRPEKVRPDEELLDLLRRLSADRRNEVVVISGRDRTTLDRWLGDLPIGLISEHGAWVRDKGGEWETVEPLDVEWKEQIRPILELYADRTPGAFVEEKDFALVWHYRKTDPELALTRSRDLTHELTQLTANLNLGVVPGKKVVEIKSASVDKGRAATRWLAKGDWDFILALGDDRTDEDAFATLPDSAYTIKVGPGPSRARYNVDSFYGARALLRKLVT